MVDSMWRTHTTIMMLEAACVLYVCLLNVSDGKSIKINKVSTKYLLINES